MENPSSKEVCVPDTPLEGDCGLLREEEASYGLRYRLPAVYGIFLMNFKEDGLTGISVRFISSFLILRRNWTNVLLYPIN